MLPSPSWLPTKVATGSPGIPATTAQELENMVLVATAKKPTAQEARRAAI
jgi:hypothetical protein